MPECSLVCGNGNLVKRGTLIGYDAGDFELLLGEPKAGSLLRVDSSTFSLVDSDPEALTSAPALSAGLLHFYLFAQLLAMRVAFID
jgi:hypothetical protein